ncbi:MAG: hypothetical protein HXX17_12510 [Geobacteraceae bacterium]|nr:hypothetical protein [Geobacteraceae bacterium]
MSFAINPSLTHIDFREADILELYRSKGEVQLPDTRFRGHPCETYICISRADKRVSATVAILETVMNSIFVYTSDYSTDQNQDYPKVLAEALEFTSSFGFTMEKVNLDFSPAMREVIIKGIRAMKPPLKRTKLRSLNSTSHLDKAPPAPSLPLVTATIPAPVTETFSEPTELQTLKKELSSARAVIEKVTREKLAIAQSASNEIELLKASLQKISEAKLVSDKNFYQDKERLSSEKHESETARNEELCNSLKAELTQANFKAESIKTSLGRNIQALNEKIALLESEKLHLDHQFRAEKDSLSKKISYVSLENESLTALLAKEKSSSDDIIASISLLEGSWQEGQQREEELCRSLDILKEQIDLLEADLDKHRHREANEESLRDRINSLEQEIADFMIDAKQADSVDLDREAIKIEIKSLTEAKNDVEAEYIRMANESIEKESHMIEALYHAESEILRLSRELDLQRQIGDMEKSALRDEIRQLLISDGSSTKSSDQANPREMEPVVTTQENAPTEKISAPKAEFRTAVSTAVNKPETAPTASVSDEDTPDIPVICDSALHDGLVNEFGSFFSNTGISSTEFHVNREIDCIEYSEPAEIVAILSSSNSVQAVPDGGGVQKCRGSVIAVKRGGKYNAYLVWHQTESDKVVICTPDQQPADAAECTQILLDAVSYFEIVGFMMEVEDLGSSLKTYNRAIRKVPALVRK